MEEPSPKGSSPLNRRADLCSLGKATAGTTRVARLSSAVSPSEAEAPERWLPPHVKIIEATAPENATVPHTIRAAGEGALQPRPRATFPRELARTV